MDSTSNGCIKLEANNDSHLNNKVSRKTKSFFKNIKNHKYRKDLLHSNWIALSLFSVGITVGQMGPTFLDLLIITNTNVEKASAFFTATSIGYLKGSVISGSVYSRVNKPFSQFLALLILGAATIATPYCKVYLLMIFMRSIVGICCGFIETIGIAEHMRIWRNEGQVLMQQLHFFFAFGDVISPWYVEPFLAKKNKGRELVPNITSHLVKTASPIGNVVFVNSSLDEDLKMDLLQSTNVHWAFLITGVCTFLSAIPFIILFFQGRNSKRQAPAKLNKLCKENFQQ